MQKNEFKEKSSFTLLPSSSLSQHQVDFPLLADSLFVTYDPKDEKTKSAIAEKYGVKITDLSYEYSKKDQNSSPYMRQMQKLLTLLKELLTELSIDLPMPKPQWITEALGLLSTKDNYVVEENKEIKKFQTFFKRLLIEDFHFLDTNARLQFYRDVKQQLEMSLYMWQQNLHNFSTISEKYLRCAKILNYFEIMNRQFRTCVDGVNGFLLELNAQRRDSADFMYQIDLQKSAIIDDVVILATKIIQFHNPESQEELAEEEKWDGWNEWESHIITLAQLCAFESKLGVKCIAESMYKNVEALKLRTLFTQEVLRKLMYPTFQRRFTIDHICQQEAWRLTQLYWIKFKDIVHEFSKITDLNSKPDITEFIEDKISTPTYEQILLQRLQVFVDLGFIKKEDIIIEKTSSTSAKKCLNPQLQQLALQPDKAKIHLFNLLLFQVERNCFQAGYFTQSLQDYIGNEIKKSKDEKTFSELVDEHGEIKLTAAIKHGKLLTVKTLLAYNIDVNIPNLEGETPLFLALRNCKTSKELQQEALARCPTLSKTSSRLVDLQAFIPKQYVTQDTDQQLQDILLYDLLTHPNIELQLENKDQGELIIAAAGYSDNIFELLIKLAAKTHFRDSPSHRYFTVLLDKLYFASDFFNYQKKLSLLEHIQFSESELKTQATKDSVLSQFLRCLCLEQHKLASYLIRHSHDGISFSQLIAICKRQMKETNFSSLLRKLVLTTENPELLMWLKIHYPSLSIDDPIILPTIIDDKVKQSLEHIKITSLGYITLLGHAILTNDQKKIGDIIATNVNALREIDDDSGLTPLMLAAQPAFSAETFTLLLTAAKTQCQDSSEKKQSEDKSSFKEYLARKDKNKSTVLSYLLRDDEESYEAQTTKLFALLDVANYEWNDISNPIYSAVSIASAENPNANLIRLLITLASKEPDFFVAQQLFIKISGNHEDCEHIVAILIQQCQKQSQFFFKFLKEQNSHLPIEYFLPIEKAMPLDWQLAIHTPYRILDTNGKEFKENLIVAAIQLNKPVSFIKLLLTHFYEKNIELFANAVHCALLQIIQKSSARQEELTSLFLKYSKPDQLFKETDAQGNLLLHHMINSSCQLSNFNRLMQAYLTIKDHSHQPEDESKDKKIAVTSSTLSEAFYQKNEMGITPFSLLLRSTKTEKFNKILSSIKLDLPNKLALDSLDPPLDLTEANHVVLYFIDAIHTQNWMNAEYYLAQYGEISELKSINPLPSILNEITIKQCSEEQILKFQEWQNIKKIIFSNQDSHSLPKDTFLTTETRQLYKKLESHYSTVFPDQDLSSLSDIFSYLKEQSTDPEQPAIYKFAKNIGLIAIHSLKEVIQNDINQLNEQKSKSLELTPLLTHIKSSIDTQNFSIADEKNLENLLEKLIKSKSWVNSIDAPKNDLILLDEVIKVITDKISTIRFKNAVDTFYPLNEQDRYRYNGFRNLQPKNCTIEDKDLHGAYFIGTELTECRFVRCNFKNANFMGANLTSAQFQECNLTHMQIDKHTKLNWSTLGKELLITHLSDPEYYSFQTKNYLEHLLNLAPHHENTEAKSPILTSQLVLQIIKKIGNHPIETLRKKTAIDFIQFIKPYLKVEEITNVVKELSSKKTHPDFSYLRLETGFHRHFGRYGATNTWQNVLRILLTQPNLQVNGIPTTRVSELQQRWRQFSLFSCCLTRNTINSQDPSEDKTPSLSCDRK